MAEVAIINSLLGNNLTSVVLRMDRRLELAADVRVPLLQGAGPVFNFHLCVKQSHRPYAGVPPTTILNHRSEFPANIACQYLNHLFSSQLLYIIPIDLLCDATNRVYDYLSASLTNPRGAVIHITADLTVAFDTTQRPPVNPLLAPREAPPVDLPRRPADLPRRPARRTAKGLKERYGFTASETTDNLGDCAVCLEELQIIAGKSSLSPRKVLKMQCSHMFHCRCIYTWLKTNDSCPLCRAVIS